MFGFHPANLAFRFVLEISALVALGVAPVDRIEVSVDSSLCVDTSPLVRRRFTFPQAATETTAISNPAIAKPRRMSEQCSWLD